MKYTIITMLSLFLFVISGCAKNNTAEYRATPKNQSMQQMKYQSKTLTEKQEELLNLQREYKIRKYVVSTGECTK